MLDVDASTVVLGLAAAGGIGTFSLYSKVAIETAGVISGIPVESDIVELDAVDGKNIFYLPPGCDYTAIMPVGESDMKKKKDKAALNEQLILESVGKANGMGPGGRNMGLRGKVRMTTSEIPNKSADVVLSSGAIGRTSPEKRGITVNEAVRILRPGGLFVFIEKEDSETEALVDKFFPQDVTAGKVVGGGEREGDVGKKKNQKKLGRRKRNRLEREAGQPGGDIPRDEEKEEEGKILEASDSSTQVEHDATAPREPKRAQAIFKQRINLLVTSYVVGIATKRTAA